VRISTVIGETLPDRAWRVALVAAVPILYLVGRRQWFIRDDWAFLLTRPLLRQQDGNAAWLLTAQDGHWMTPPLLIYRLIQNLFGVGSYWPYLLPTMALHVAAVLLVRALCRRHGVSPWTTVLLCTLLLLFGGGWEDIVFAIQLVYNISLVAFLAQLLLVDHDGPADRRDAAAAALGVVSITSSGFGPFFMVGIALLLGLRRRWRALATVVVPQALLYAWWWLSWGEDPVGATSSHSLTGAIKYARLGLTATLNSVTGQVLFAGAAFLGIVAMCVWTTLTWQRRSVLLAMCLTVVAMFLGIGYQRAGLGIDSATVSRYQYMAAMLLVPTLGLAVDQLRRFDRRALLLAQLLLAVALVQNVRLLVRSSDDWADRSAAARHLFSVVWVDPRTAGADQSFRISTFNPDVTLGSLQYLDAEGALEDVVVLTGEEATVVDRILDGFPADDDAP
jgi:hypothetical protein